MAKIDSDEEDRSTNSSVLSVESVVRDINIGSNDANPLASDSLGSNYSELRHEGEVKRTHG